MSTYNEGYWRSEIDTLQGLSQIEKARSKQALGELRDFRGQHHINCGTKTSYN